MYVQPQNIVNGEERGKKKPEKKRKSPKPLFCKLWKRDTSVCCINSLRYIYIK